MNADHWHAERGTRDPQRRFAGPAFRRIILLLVSVVWFLSTGDQVLSQSIVGSKHDLSSFSWTGGEICITCHSPHGGMGSFLWNHTLSTQVYSLHNGLDAVDYSQPTELSKQCLGCHDGSVGVDDFGGTLSDGKQYFLTGRYSFGTDLTIHHPVSFTFDSALANNDGALRDPATTDSGLGGTIAAKMLRNGRMECASCHDPHNNSNGDFLVKPLYGRGAPLCNTCHFDSGPANHHIPRRDAPWTVGNCTLCHGTDLKGTGQAPACTNCHNDFSEPGIPPTGHHFPGRDQPFANHCTDCHGADLLGGLGPSCYECHDKVWSGDPSQAIPPANHDQFEQSGNLSGWHKPGGLDPVGNGCTLCHGPNLDDGFASACSHCHDPAWDGHNFTGKPWLAPTDAICLPCHDGPDWNHALSPTAGYTVSTSTLSPVGDPTGRSQKCLSCHEGNVAVDNFQGTLSNGTTNFLSASKTFGADLTQHHPVSFAYDTILTSVHGGLNDPTITPSGLPAGGTIEQDMLENFDLQCTSCHNQHGSGRDLLYQTPRGGLCFTCHIEKLPNDVYGLHHIPRRDAPWDGDFSCTQCHGSDLLGAGAAPSCTNCHNPFASPDKPPAGHHGGDRFNPSVECSTCHGQTLRGKLDFAGISPPSCYRCHGNLWTGVPVVNAGGPYAGTTGELIQFDASGTTDDGGLANLSFEWVFGDGSDPVFPVKGDATATHVYSSAGTYNGLLTVTDGQNRPVVVPFVVVVTDPAPPPTPADSWRVTVASPPEQFTLTIDKKDAQGDGVFVAVKDDGTNPVSLALGIEFTNVIFWMDIWMDVNANVLWGTGSIYFGNIDRGIGRMSGVVFTDTGAVTSFSGVSAAVSN